MADPNPIVRLNAEAIVCLRQEDYGNASSLFDESTDILARYVEAGHTAAQNGSLRIVSVSTEDDEYGYQRDAVLKSHNTIAIYDRAFLAVPVREGADLSSIANQNLMAITVLYNTALTSHLRGTQDIRQQDQHLLAALTSYRKAVQLLPNCDFNQMDGNLVYLASKFNVSACGTQNQLRTLDVLDEARSTTRSYI